MFESPLYTYIFPTVYRTQTVAFAIGPLDCTGNPVVPAEFVIQHERNGEGSVVCIGGRKEGCGCPFVINTYEIARPRASIFLSIQAFFPSQFLMV